MSCDDVRLAVSLRADGELGDGPAGDTLDAHLATCAECRGFADDVQHIRSQLRVEAVDHVPDVGPAVVARLRAPAGAADRPDSVATIRDPQVEAGRPAPPAAGKASPRPTGAPGPARSGRRRLAVAAAIALVAGAAAGGTFVGIGTEPRSPAAADVPDLVMDAQHDVSTLESRLRITEAGAAEAGGPAEQAGQARTFAVDLSYRAPESLALHVRETTPDRPAAVRDAGDLVVDGDSWWQRTSRRCLPAEGLVRCPDDAVAWVRSVTGREPFSSAAPTPLDLVIPVGSFTPAAEPAALGTATVAGHRAVGVAVTAAQVSPLIEGLSSALDLRAVHPTDEVELWLDGRHLVPLALVVRAADSSERQHWASSVGAVESAGDTILTVTATTARVNGGVDPDAFEPPAGEPSSSLDAGFRDAPVRAAALDAAPVPAHLPDGFRTHRSGTVATPGGPTVAVRSWSDGRAWLTVRATTGWPGGRLFGELGSDVRPVDLGAAGAGYASSDGRRLALHTADADLVVSGSLPADRLEAVAADLGVVGLPVPPSWDEAATAGLDEAARALPGLLVAATLDGFGPPSVRVDGDTVTQSHAGAGRRGLTITQRVTPTLSPPSAGDEAGVTVRGTAGRYSRQRGELEWIEGDLAVSLRSDSLGLAELLAIADHLEPR
jgi:hypothetical protein